MNLDYSKIAKYISTARLEKYNFVCKEDKQKVIKLYQTNLRLSQSFYSLLSLFEVILRNALNEEFTTSFKDPDWLKNQLTGFMTHPSLCYKDKRTGKLRQNDFLKNSVEKTIRDLGSAATHGKIIADLKFGFWTALFDNTHYKILAGRPIKIFSKLPKGANRNLINNKLIMIREFRNRIYHYEPVIFEKDSSGNIIFSTKQTELIYKDIQDFFIWLDIDFEAWTKKINNIPFEIKRANTMFKMYPAYKYYFHRILLGLKYYKQKYF